MQNVDVESVGAMPNVMADPGGRVLHRCKQEEEVGGILSFSPRGAYFFFRLTRYLMPPISTGDSNQTRACT